MIISNRNADGGEEMRVSYFFVKIEANQFLVIGMESITASYGLLLCKMGCDLLKISSVSNLDLVLWRGLHRPTAVKVFEIEDCGALVGMQTRERNTIAKFAQPSAKDLLKHWFIRNTRKSPMFLERIRCNTLLLFIELVCCTPTKTNMVAKGECPKDQIKDAETPRNGPKGIGEGSDTVKVGRDIKAMELFELGGFHFFIGKPFKNAERDFSIGRSQTTRTPARPPQVREKKAGMSYNKDSQRASESGNHLLFASGNALPEPLELLFGKDASDPYHDDREDNSHDEVSLSQVIHYASTSGTVAFHGQHDESDSPRIPKSRLGMQERTSSASLEDSVLNLAEVISVLVLRANFIRQLVNMAH
ncbi:unnamed protein product [Dovyalis caffra]|uniref:Uncharacterized protein n=1 Tax=Dovyalis caffra TaxID=77055 RepID=A0AAV1SMU7_9ROSI|nr:unnamed protein product [Dovyalis caffra]